MSQELYRTTSNVCPAIKRVTLIVMSLVLLFRYRKTPCSSPFTILSLFFKSSFKPLVSLTFSVHFSPSPFNDQTRFSRSSATFTVPLSLVLNSYISSCLLSLSHFLSFPFSLSDTILPTPRTRTSPYRKWLFPSSTKSFGNSNGITLCAILWDKCLTRGIIKREAGKEPDVSQEVGMYSVMLISSARRLSGLVRITSVFSFANDYYDRSFD